MDFSLPVGSAIGGALNTAGAVASGIFNLRAQKLANQANYNLAKAQNDWNIEQWNRENEYNSPANQVELLKSAGLNPNLYSPNGSTAPHLESSEMANQQPRQIDNSIAQTGAQALEDYAHAEELRASIAESRQRQRIAETMLPYQVQAADLNNGLMADQRTIAYWQGQLGRQAYTNERLDAPLRRSNLSMNTRNLAQNIEASKAGIRATEQGILASKAQIDQAWQDLRIKARVSDQQIKNMQADFRNMQLNGDLLQFRAQMAKKYHIDPNLPALNNLITFALADPTQFSSAFQTIRTNIGGLFNEGRKTGSWLGDAFDRFMNRSSHFNPSSGSW